MPAQTDLERVITWLKTYPDNSVMSKYSVDFTDKVPSNGGIFPSGLQEISRREDIVGNITVANQYNFGLYYVLPKPLDDDATSTDNAEWLMEFQRWVQEQSLSHAAPTFGNVDIGKETIKAQNGVLYSQGDEGTAIYMVQLAAQFKIYKEA